jgi:hypothetical protein
MTDVIAKIMVEVLLITGLLTKGVGQGRASMSFLFDLTPKTDLLSGKFFKKLVGKKDVEDALQRLDKLTQELAQMAETEALTITRRNDNEMKDADDSVEVVNSKGHDVAHSSQQSGTKPGHKSPRGGGVPSIATLLPLRPHSVRKLLPIASSSSGFHPDIRPTSAGEYDPF